MKLILSACIASLILVACGVDGEPEKPTVTTQTTIGYSSVTGAYNKTSIGFSSAVDHFAAAHPLFATGDLGGGSSLNLAISLVWGERVFRVRPV